ncbi:MAG: T9SS type A sorting domain-containing protein, partial [Bacteroidia bacterium]
KLHSQSPVLMKGIITLLAYCSFLLASGQSSTLFPVPANSAHEGAIIQYVDGAQDFQTFFKLSRENELNGVESFVEYDSVSIVLIGMLKNRSAYSLLLFNMASNELQELHTFDSTGEIDFSDELYLDKSGNCVGVVLNGQSRDSGFVYSYSFGTSTFSRIMELEKNTVSGMSPSFAFDKDSNMLYGSSTGGGVDNLGFLFRVDLNAKSITQLFQITLISSTSLYARHLDYDPNMGLYGYLDHWSDRQILFRLKNTFFTLLHEFDKAIELPTGSVCVAGNKLVGASIDWINERQLIYKIDANGSNREYISIHKDTAFGASNYRSIFALNDSMVVFCSSNGGSYSAGNLLKVNINDWSITPGLSFRSSHGNNPERMLFSEKTGRVHVHLKEGASGKRGSLLSVNLADNAYVQTTLAGMPFGTTISNSVAEMGNKKIAYLAESGGAYGKGVLGIIDYSSKEIDTLISFGGENRTNDSTFHTPDISSLFAVNDTLLAFHFSTGGPHLRGGMAFFSTKSMAITRVIDFSSKENQRPVGRISSNGAGGLVIWTNLDYPSDPDYKFLQVSIQQGTVDTLSSLSSYGIFEFHDKQMLAEGTNIYAPYIGFTPPFGFKNPDGLAKFDGNDFTYTEFQKDVFGTKIGTNVLKVEQDRVAFIMTSDVPFGYGKLILYDVNSKKSEVFTYDDLSMAVSPVGGIYHDKLDNSIYTLCSDWGDYGYGALMKFDLYTRTFSSLVDFRYGTDFSDIDTYSPQITRVHPFPLGTEPLDQEQERGLTLYPNPGDGTFYIDAKEAVDIEIYTIQGSLIYSAKGIAAGSPISLAHVPKGIYLIKIAGENKVQKLVIR